MPISIRMRLTPYFFMSIQMIGLFASPLAMAKNQPSANACSSFMMNAIQKATVPHSALPIIHAPQKPILTVNPSQLKSENGAFLANHEYPDLSLSINPNLNHHYMARVIPDSNTSLGRVAKALDRWGTHLVFDDLGLQRMNGGGYASPYRRFRIFNEDFFDNDWIVDGPVIALRESFLNTNRFQRILMHESLHNKGRLLREANIEYDFNSFMKANGDRKLYSNSHLYQERMHHEEVRAYANNFIFTPIKAHNRKTIQEIESLMKKIDGDFTREEKLKMVKLEFSSVVDPADYDKHLGEITGILDSHLKNLDYVSAHLGKFRRSFYQGEKPTLQILAGKQGTPIVIETEKLNLTLGNIKAPSDGVYDFKAITQEVAQIRETDWRIRAKVENVRKLIDQCREKGYFTAEDYFKLKSLNGELSKSMRLPSLPQRVK
jgi:hypothetical protein